MRTTVHQWLIRLVLVTTLQAAVSLFSGATAALADTPPCPTGTNWDSATQQCR
ncbi:MAG TPA: hypothetical protein VFM55_03045 [Micromonosporaceae bacterium]|nr:hypothetical protein [Micromonosporaceae bacterium]